MTKKTYKAEGQFNRHKKQATGIAKLLGLGPEKEENVSAVAIMTFQTYFSNCKEEEDEVKEEKEREEESKEEIPAN